MKRLIGVGVGPGDPELVTVKAVRVLREADVVLVPVLAAADPRQSRQSRHSQQAQCAQQVQQGRAETIIRAYADAGRMKRLEFALNDTGGVTPRRAAAWRAAAAAVAEEFAAGADNVAFGTLGDPNLYSTFSYLAQTVRDLVPGVRVETVAGITAMQDLASRAGISLAEGTEPVTLVPLNGGPGALDRALAGGGTVVGYKVGAAASPAPGDLRHRLEMADRLADAVIGARLGLEGELIAPAADVLAPSVAPPGHASPPPHVPPPSHVALPTQAPPSLPDIPDIPYLSTLIVPARRATGVGSGLAPVIRERQAPPVAQASDNDHEEQRADRNDGASMSLGQQRWNIDVVEHSVGAGMCGADAGERDAGGGKDAGAGEGDAGAGKDAGAGERDPDAGERDADGGTSGAVFFVGAGPGAPDLLTQRGAAAIAQADVVIWSSSLVHPDILKHAGHHAEIIDSARLPMEGVLPYYERAAQRNQRVARVHSGDPSLWGAVQEQLDRCKALGLRTEIVPGVSSFTAVAARIRRELTIPEVAQSVILTRLGGGKTPMPPGERVAEFARHGTTMALFLSAARSGQLQEELLRGGYPPDTPCVVAYQVTWPDELILRCHLEDLAATMKQRKLWKHTLVLVGPALVADGRRSHLYHPGHFHGYRKADRQARKQLREATPQDTS
ncbi:MAG: precorrin-4 C(11)-methyltransferase [Actinobacteria bacterium]|nr:precorrin-4 C(11)-methyltransferase [Actinomycetota bacterium]